MEVCPDSPIGFEIKVELFDGPIDLLLHLVKKNELPIEKLSLAQVANQYLQCLEKMEELDLDIASEYLVVAATLLSIKASFILDGDGKIEGLEDDGLLSPHQELLERLRAAQIFKESAQALGHRPLLGVDVFSAPSLLSEIEAPEDVYVDHSALLLGRAFKKILDRLGDDNNLMKITISSVSIVDRMMKVMEILKSRNGKVVFYELIPDTNDRISVIASFLSILELCKRRIVVVQQGENFEEIFVALADEPLLDDKFESEFDEKIGNIANG